jgi:hypothetical protein
MMDVLIAFKASSFGWERRGRHMVQGGKRGDAMAHGRPGGGSLLSQGRRTVKGEVGLG